MMKYTEQLLSPPLKTSSAYTLTSPTPQRGTQQVVNVQDNRISLTPLWEFVVRTQSLPEGLNLDLFFQAIQERLRNPEREVRQHALRVLTDFIPVIEPAILDEKMKTVLSDLVANLGHLGPAIRKGATDCLRAYLNCSNNSDNVLKDVVYNGLEKGHENKIKTNITVGIVIALPFFLQKASEESVLYIIRLLFEKMVQITYQEVSLRSLFRIKNVLGDEKFDNYIKFSGSNSSRKDFDLLCEVYGLQGKNLIEAGTEGSPYQNRNYWNDFNPNIVEESDWRSDTEVMIREKEGEVIEDKVILETEIKLHKGPAITMQIHEESRQIIPEVTDSEDEGRNSMGIVKILTDESEDDYGCRRTPRRVRFGGEIVKLRTPDSDSNQPSDLDNDSTITITPREGKDDKPLIEIHYTDTKSQRSTSVPKSHIPIPHSMKHKTVQSEPNSPARMENKTKRRMLFRSSPNIAKTQIFGEKVPNSGSRIPRRNKFETSTRKEKEKQPSHTTTIQIRLTDFPSKSKIKQSSTKNIKQYLRKPIETGSTKGKVAEENKLTKQKPNEPNEGQDKPQSGSNEKSKLSLLPSKEAQPKIEVKAEIDDSATSKNEGELSPAAIHSEIEMFHNLTRSPERKTPDSQRTEENVANNNNKNNGSTKCSRNSNGNGADNSETEVSKETEENVRTVKNSEDPVKKRDPTLLTNEERHLKTADDVLLNREFKNTVNSRNIRTADQINKSTFDENGVAPAVNNPYNSFHVCSSTLTESLNNYVDSPIPTNDNGDCLTCSSSGSDNMVLDTSWEDVVDVDRNIINKLNCKNDWRIRLRGLEDLNRTLQNQATIEALERKASSLLHFLFSCEQHVRLQSAAEDILKILFSNMQIETLQSRLNQITVSLCKMGSPAGVRLSILLMRRITAAEFLDQLLKSSILGAKSSKIREGALQILMTISRIFPSTEVNVVKATETVTPLLHDRKKRVRRASLETIAALAQLGANGAVLDIITKVSSSYPDKEQMMRVVRTRLSRKQLPSVDLNGSVRYSTPSGESELEWISIGSTTTSPQCLQHNVILEGQKINFNNNDSVSKKTESTAEDQRLSLTNNAATDVNSVVGSANRYRANYWKGTDRFIESNDYGTKYQAVNESDGSGDFEETKDDLKQQNLQIWAVDPWTLSTPVKLSASNGTLHPLYLIQRDQLQTNGNLNNSPKNYDDRNTNAKVRRNQRHSPRGRSFSPPKRQHDSKSEEPQRFINVNGEDKYVGNSPPGLLQKSSSSDHIRCKGNQFSASTSSSNSGTSMRHANWHKNFKSGIPVPVSSDSRLRFKTRQIEAVKGPISIPSGLYKTKSPTPQDTPDRSVISQRAVLVRQPFSSGSDSSEFYTPPAEPHLATNFTKPAEEIILQSPRQSESFVEVDTPRYHNENFMVIDDSPQDDLDQNKAFTRVESGNSQSDYTHFNTEDKLINRANVLQRQDTLQTEDSFHVQDEFESEEIFQTSVTFTRNDTFEGEDIFDKEISVDKQEIFHTREPSPRLETFNREETFDEDNAYHEVNPSGSLDNIDMYDTSRTFLENRSLSKSEVNLQKVAEISRKSVSSAPALNDVLHHIRYESFDESPMNSTQTSIPGAIVEFLPEKEDAQLQEITVITKSATKTPRTNISKPLSRKNSVRASHNVSTFSDNLTPFSKPKEGVSETLMLLEHTDWEMTMKGLQGIVRLTRYHPEVTEIYMHSICVALGKQIKNLRSQVARAACLAASEMFSNHKKPLEMELEELAVPLLHRTADTNKFLRSDANAALDKMCLNMAPHRVVSVVAIKGAGHQNAIVRCTSARLLCSLTNRLGSEKIFQLPKDTRDKILYSGANMLMEGNLETRKHAKMMFGNLSGHCLFNRAMMEAVPVCTMRHIQKTLKSLQ